MAEFCVNSQKSGQKAHLLALALINTLLMFVIMCLGFKMRAL